MNRESICCTCARLSNRTYALLSNRTYALLSNRTYALLSSRTYALLSSRTYALLSSRTYALLSSRKAKLKPLIIIGLFFMFLLGSLNTFSQTENQAETQLEPFLLLEKPGTKKRIRYYIGDQILFKLKGQSGFHKGTIVQFSDTSFYVNDFEEIPLRNVGALADRTKGGAVRGIAASALAAIPVFFVLSAANNIFNTGDTPIVDKEVYPLSIVFLGIGGLGMLYRGKRYRLKNRWRIIMVRL